MIAYYAKDLESDEPRAHPWTTTVADETLSYVDFKEEPEKIRTSLEDWIPFMDDSFAIEFFDLLEWINGQDSTMESNDCAFIAPSKNIDKKFKFKRRSSGRLMILYRDLILNCQSGNVDWLFNMTMREIESIDKLFKAGAIGLSFQNVVYKDFSDDPDLGAKGWQITFSFFAYGSSDFMVNKNMFRVIKNLKTALQSINERIKQGDHTLAHS